MGVGIARILSLISFHSSMRARCRSSGVGVESNSDAQRSDVKLAGSCAGTSFVDWDANDIIPIP